MTPSRRSTEERNTVRTCPVCDLDGVGITALMAAAFDSNGRCTKCGSAIRFNGVKHVLVAAAFAVGLAVGLELESLWSGLGAGVATATFVLLSPIRPDKTDPATFRETLRGSRKASK
jgi:hypothetical protein